MTEAQTQEMQERIRDDEANSSLQALGDAAVEERRASQACARVVMGISMDKWRTESEAAWKVYCAAAVKLKLAVAAYAATQGVPESSTMPTPPAQSPAPSPPS